MSRSEAVACVALALPFLAGSTVAPVDPGGDELFRFTDPDVVESSGLVVDGPLLGGGLVLTVNDSGDVARVFAVDPATGDTVGTTSFASADGADVDDVEALAPAGPGRVWVADVGDNARSRDEVRLYEVPVGRGRRDVVAEPLTVSYPDGAHDAESLVRHPGTGRLAIVTKDVLGGTVQALPRGAGPGDEVVTEPLGGVLGLATDAAFWPDGRHLLVRGYGGARAYAWPGLEPVGDLPLPRQRQGEGLAVSGDGRVLVSSEGLRQPVLAVAVPAPLRAALEGRGPVSRGAPEPVPAARADDAAPGPWSWAGGALVVAVVGLAGWALVRRPRGA